MKSAIAVCCILLAFKVSSLAGEWPQVLGPHRNGQADGETLASHWPDEGPPGLWEHKVGNGFAGVAVASDTLIVFHRESDHEIVEALHPQTGRRLWRQAFPTTYRASIVPDDGPRCVPVIHDARVYVYGASGGLHCLALKSGKPIWSVETHQQFGAAAGYFGAGSTPIIEGEQILVNVGGRDGAGIVAFDLATGKTAWQTTDDAASYSSPIAATIDGARHVIFITRLNVVSVDPENGDVRFRFPFGARGPTVNGASPTLLGRRLFVTASYGVGAVFAEVSGGQAQELWRSDDVLSSQYTTPVANGDVLYGIDGRQDVGRASLRCIAPNTRRVLWDEADFGYATLIKADDKLLIVKTDGTIVLAAADPSRFRKLAEARILSGTTRALPALSSGRLYVRNESTLKCVNVGR